MSEIKNTPLPSRNELSDSKETEKKPTQLELMAQSLVRRQLEEKLGKNIEDDDYRANYAQSQAEKERRISLEFKKILKEAPKDKEADRAAFLAKEFENISNKYRDWEPENLEFVAEKQPAGPKGEYPSTKEAEEKLEAVEKDAVKLTLFGKARAFFFNRMDNVNARISLHLAGVRESLQKKMHVERKEGETDEEYAKRQERIALGTTLATAAVVSVAYAAYRFNMDADMNSLVPGFDGGGADGGSGASEALAANGDVSGGGASESTIMSIDARGDMPSSVHNGHDTIGGEAFDSGGASDPFDNDLHGDIYHNGGSESTFLDGYVPADNAFNMEGKIGAHDWFPPLAGDTPELRGGDLLDKLRASPEQFATVAKELGLIDPNMSADAAQQRMIEDPDFARQIIDQMESGQLTFSEGEPLHAGDSYGSFFASGGEQGILVSYDSHVVDQESGVTVMRFVGSDGVERVLEFRDKCGQPIFREQAQEQFIANFVPQGGGEAPAPQGGGEAPAPQGGGEAPPPPEGGGDVPPPENPPENPETPTPPPENPPENPETPPTSVEQKSADVSGYEEDTIAPDAPTGELEEGIEYQPSNPDFLNQSSEQAVPTEQLGGASEGATMGDGGSRSEMGSGSTGAEAGAADLNQTHESASENDQLSNTMTSPDDRGQEAVI